jgi:hypothetical protein
VQGFVDRVPVVFASAATHPGFIAHAPSRAIEVPRNDRDWGVREAPRFFKKDVDPPFSDATTLSVWRDLESARRFAYASVHLEALQKRKEWFRPPEWPTYVAWWIEDDETPTWGDAFARLEYIHDHGPSPYAFNFKQAFDGDGNLLT